MVVRTYVTRSLAWTITLTLSLALSSLPLSCNVLAVVLAHLPPLVRAAAVATAEADRAAAGYTTAGDQ